VVEPVVIAHTPVAHCGEEEQAEVKDLPEHVEVVVEQIDETH
jgi:hypothetical protein